jgi:hypothetical protein
MARVEWELTTLDDLNDNWWESWNRINETSLGAQPALSAHMARLLLKYFGNEAVRGASLYVNGNVAAQLLLQRANWAQWRVFCPSQAPVGLLVFDRSIQIPQNCLQSLFRIIPTALEINLPRQDAPYSLLSGCNSAAIHRAKFWTTIAIQSSDGFDTYWAQRPKELKDNLRRRSRRAEQEGMNLLLTKLDTPGDVSLAVDRYGELESRGWKSKEGSALHPSNRQGQFYRELLTGLADRGAAQVYELHSNGRLTASRLLISGPNMHIVLKTTHDEELRQYAVGHLQLQGILKDLLTCPQPKPVELYMNATRDWMLWATHSRDMENVSVYRHGLIARAAELRRQAHRGSFRDQSTKAV